MDVLHSPAPSPEDWLRFVLIPPFERQWEQIGLDEEALRLLEISIMVSPRQGAVVQGAGGVRKLRFTPSDSNKGKRGGYRVFYAYFPDHGVVLLLAVIAKSVQSDLNMADRAALARIIRRIEGAMERGDIR
jgi:mRNA-degrading endonuclease RelE of RelBE toxin-antitoxin system